MGGMARQGSTTGDVSRSTGRDPPKILIVDDDKQVRTVVTWQLESEHFDVEEAGDGDAALRKMISVRPDLLVLDLSLPGRGGLEVLSAVRREGSLPVIVLTARRDEIERIVALDLGADDYVTKPFSPRELAARVRSVLRRCAPVTPVSVLDYGPLWIDLEARAVHVAGTPVELTAREFDLLAFLAASPMKTFSRARLLAEVWSSARDWQMEATVTEHMYRLRQKVESEPANPRWLRTVRNVGYRFEPPPAPLCPAALSPPPTGPHCWIFMTRCCSASPGDQPCALS